MARNASDSRTDPAVKGQQTRPGDAAEPPAVSDAALSFDQVDLERSADPAPAPGPDPFDPASLRLSEDFNASMGFKKALLTVPVRKPDKSWFVRTHPDPDYRLQTSVIELKEDRETYLAARELHSGRLERLWLADGATILPPYPIGPETLFVAYYASAELGRHLALDWPIPLRILDLYVEFRCLTAGRPVPCGNGLLGALAYFGLDGLAAVEKDEMRQLAMRGGPYTEAERMALTEYCQSDVDSLAQLLTVILPRIDLPRALLRGRYMAAAARMEWNGIPLNLDSLARLRSEWEQIKGRLVAAVDARYHVFQPAGQRTAELMVSNRTDGPPAYRPMRFSAARWREYLARRGIPWPLLPSGELPLDDDTFREMARAYPDDVGPIRELRHALSQLRLQELAVGSDRRNRLLLSAFASKTGRNQPSNSRFIFGPSCWLRSLIRPEPGQAVAYVDWSQQELGIAAALSGDTGMQEAYRSGDCYLTFAKMAGAVPANATKQSHGAERDQFKTVALGVLYGLSSEGLARRMNAPPCRGRELLRLHQQTFRRFWKWSDQTEMQGMLTGELRTVFGWTVHVCPNANPRSLRNFPMQGNGAEMLRLACCLATERGIKVCAPVHDALLVEGPAEGIETVVKDTQSAMQEASELVLRGFPLRTDAKIVQHPDRYADPRGKRMWETVWSVIRELDSPETARIAADTLFLSPAIPPPSYSLVSNMDPYPPTHGDPFDPTQLRLLDAGRPLVQPPTKPPRHRPGERFLRGPIPWPWLDAAARPRSGRGPMHVAGSGPEPAADRQALLDPRRPGRKRTGRSAGAPSAGTGRSGDGPPEAWLWAGSDVARPAGRLTHRSRCPPVRTANGFETASILDIWSSIP
jgi:hypothetical protein